MAPQFRNIVVAVAALACASSALAATRTTYEISGAPKALSWAPTAFPLAITVDRKLVERYPDAHPAIARGLEAWSLPDTEIAFQTPVVGDARIAGNDRRNVIGIADDLFRNQGALALTTYTFDETGRFIDADIQLDPMLMMGGYNVHQTVQHEIGHMLGFDHSAVLSSVMYPYVPRGSATPVFAQDDTIAATAAYATSDPTLLGATLQGRLVGDSGGVFAAQVVALNDEGHPVATALTNADGEFRLVGVPAGRYRIYAEPLDGPVVVRDLNGVWRSAKVTPFPTEFMDGDWLTVEGGKLYGNLILNTSGPATLNPRWVGTRNGANESVSLSSSALTVRAGQPVTIAVGGDGFISGMTEFEVMNPAFQRVSDFRWSGNYVTADFLIKGDAQAGSAVILVRSGNANAALTGALKIMPSGSTTRRRAAG